MNSASAHSPIPRLAASTSLLLGVYLLALNLWGLFSPLRNQNIYNAPPSHFHFANDRPLPYKDSLSRLEALAKQGLSEADFVASANQLVSQSLSHIEWQKLPPSLYHAQVPAKHNFILFLLGQWSGLEYYQRYQFTEYHRSLERGVGICGEAVMVLNQLLDQQHIDNDILAFDGHVVSHIRLKNGQELIADPDFGVLLDTPPQQLAQSSEKISRAYQKAGYSEQLAQELIAIYSNTEQTRFNDTYHFLTKRYLLERISYVAIWLIPILLLSHAGFYFLRRQRP